MNLAKTMPVIQAFKGGIESLQMNVVYVTHLNKDSNDTLKTHYNDGMGTLCSGSPTSITVESR